MTVSVSGVLLVALARKRHEQSGEVQRLGRPLPWIVVGGVVLPAIILVPAFAYTVYTQARIADPPSRPAATIHVIGHRWWWEVRYVGGGADQTVVTANEIHVPVGQPVQLELTSDDVIHSFWVPRLAGKMDLIPGQRNTMWLRADSAGTYWGQCAEYCGLQHAHMDFIVVADAPAAYAAWRTAQLAAATAPSDSLTKRGLAVFLGSPCATCHAIRGADALGRIGPDLTHLQSRQTLGAGALSNTRANLAQWIADAQSIKPGSGMPPIALPLSDSRALLAYLETLR
ncbi:MAG: cytochrome c oxidase subunit II [Gemmatimonadota bacterium]|nr:cytochrome c oxidase subunit II [Gemmatimonadota bacterium]